MDSSAQRRKAVLYLFFAATLWSTGGVMIKAISWGPIAILSGRSIFSAIVLLIFLRRFPIRHWTRWKVTAMIAHILTALLFVTSTKLTTAANAIFLQYTAPLYIIILGAWFLKERPSRNDWISMLVIFTGMALFFGDKLSFTGLEGNVLAVLSGLSLAIMNVALRAQKDGDPAESIVMGQLITALVGLPWIFKESWTATNWLIILYLGIFQIGLAFVFFTTAIKHVPAIEATLISTLEPVINPIWVFLFIGEEPGRFALLGAAIVLAGVALNAIGSARAALQPADP